MGTKATLHSLESGKKGRKTFLDEKLAHRTREEERIMSNVCSAIQMNYYKGVQNAYSKWQLLTKLKRENQHGNQTTKNKILLLKTLTEDQTRLKQKVAFDRWRQLAESQRKREEISCVI